MTIRLRDYQITGIDEIINAWKNCKSVLFQMPTGTGKTTLFCEIVRKFITELYPDKKVLIITHRKELVEQVFNRLVSDFHLTTGIISANFIGIQSSPIQVASIQTLVRRDEHQKDIFSLVIIDEAHHALASTYRQLWDFYPSSRFLGVTATPIRTNGEGFQDLFDKLITTASIKWFIKNKHLSDIRYFANHTPDVSNIKIRAGDYDETELSEVMQDNAVMADLVQSYIDFAIDKKMIVFAVNRAHCTKIVEKFNSSGFPAKAIDTYTSTDERRKIVNDFRNNQFKILCNVNIFTEGFDCPDVDAIQLARPTKSLTLFLQQVGRCMRPHENKQYGIVLDNAGLWKEHGLPKMDRNWSLNGADKNICPSQKAIIGIKEILARGNNEPQESKGIRLAEVGELDNIISANTINFNNIEKNLIDKKILTMRERIEYLIKQVQKLEQRRATETDEDIQEIIDDKIKVLQKELFDLQEKLQPKRFEQVIELIIGKCQEMIDSNEIFVEGDKDTFLKFFVEPYLKSNNQKDIQENFKNIVHENRKINTVIEEIARVEKRIPKWFQKPEQNNTKILIAFFKIEQQKGIVKVTDLENACVGINFNSHFGQMKKIDPHNHAKVFDVNEEDRIVIWKPVEEFIKNEFNKYLTKDFTSTKGELENNVLIINDVQTDGFITKGVFLKNGLKLRKHFKGNLFEAEVRNESIKFNNERFTSPSSAAVRATGTSINGWIFWEFFDESDGKWKLLETLRHSQK